MEISLPRGGSSGQTIDFLLTAKRDIAAVLCFFLKAIRHHSEPEVVTVDKSGTNAVALATLNADKPYEEVIIVRQSKYLRGLEPNRTETYVKYIF